MRVLGIETSCDETGVAIYDSEQGLLADALYSQIDLHKNYGGVVPELASRDHVRKLLPLIQEVMDQSGSDASKIDGICYTAGPGLMGALLVGASLARALAYAWQVPAVGVHHMEGHLLAPMLEQSPPQFPFIALLVSGGHTQLVEVKGIGQYQLLGESVDDAAGEAFDKVAKMLELDYPGGPAIAAAAAGGDGSRFNFPLPMTRKPGLDFSFSGLKTFTANLISLHSGEAEAKSLPEGQILADITAGFQQAVVDTLSFKCRRALRETGMKRLVIAGGVSANKQLRQVLEAMVAKEGAELFYARPEFCTDNGAMIAFAGCQRLLAGQSEELAITAVPRWPMEQLPAVNA